MAERISYDANGNMLIDGAYLSVKANSYKVSDSFKNAIKNIELQFKNAAISEEEYYKKMESLRNSYLEKGTKEWWSYTNKIVSYEKKQFEQIQKEQEKLLEKEKKQIEKVYEEIASGIYKTQDEILKSQEKFAKKMSDFVNVSRYEKYVFPGYGENGGDLIQYKTSLYNLDEQKEKLKSYYNLLTAVKKQGTIHFGEEGFMDFFEMLKSYSIDEGASLAESLLNQTDEGFYEFVSDWNEIQSMTKDFSKKLNISAAKEAAEEGLSYMKKVLSEYGMEIPEGFYLSGSVSAEKFGEGFCDKIQNVLDDISEKFNNIMPEKGILGKSIENAGMPKSVFAPTYNLYGSGETIASQLRSAAARAMVDKLRGGY